MPLLPFGEWKPDVSDYEGQTTQTIQNVVPRGDGYGPFKDFTVLSAALPAKCRGGFYALKSDGSVAIFAATSTKIFLANNSDFTWKPVSKVTALTSISQASPAVFTKTAHGLAADEAVVLSTSGALPTGLTVDTIYYVKTVLSADTFTVSATVGGAAINTSSAGSGTHSMTSVYSAVSASAQWQFCQFGNFVIAVQENTVPQVYDLSSSTAFADLGGSPPQAAYVSVVGRFVVLSGLLSTPYRIQWSGLNATTTWTSGTNSSDYQDLPDGGIVRGVAGGENGVIFQDQAIRRMSYIPGSPLVFQIERISEQQGLFGPYSIVRSGERIFFHSAQGFHQILPGQAPTEIGREKIDRTFFDELDKGDLKHLIGASDPRSTKVFWAYKTEANSGDYYDRILGYDYVLERFFKIVMSGDYLLGLSQPGLTLENLDSISASLDALAVSLDNFAVSSTPVLSQFNSTFKLGFFTGSNLEATLESAEQGTDGTRVFFRGFRPVTDSATVYGSIKYRDDTSGAVSTTAESLKSTRTGLCNVRISARYGRMKARIPAGTTWTFIAGVEPDVAGEGKH